ncbi:MAG: DMT family transporter [Eubacteriaceae bacterium]|nr:DMT family transporter [Eubacteriaceae bacterium]
MHKDTQLTKAYITGIGFSVMVGFSFLGVKVCTRVATTLQILTIRYDFAMLAVLVFMLLRLGRIDMNGKPKKDLLLTAAFYIGFMILQTIGLYFATSVESAILFAIIPIMVKIIAEIFLKERSTMLQNIFVCISVAALIAMIILGATNLTVNFVGVAVLLLSSLSMAINNVYMRFTRNTYTPFEITFMICLLGFVVFNAISLVNGAVHGTMAGYFEPCVHVEFVVATAYLGICCILFSAQMMAYMQAHMPAVNASLFGNVSTAISVISGVVVLGEPLRWYHIVCAVLIIIGAVGMNMSGRKELQ